VAERPWKFESSRPHQHPLKTKDFSEGLEQFGTLPFPEYAVKRSKRGGGWADSGLLNYRMMRGHCGNSLLALAHFAHYPSGSFPR